MAICCKGPIFAVVLIDRHTTLTSVNKAESAAGSLTRTTHKIDKFSGSCVLWVQKYHQQMCQHTETIGLEN